MTQRADRIATVGKYDGSNILGVGSGIISINGDVTPAQILAAGTGISVVAGPLGTHTINNTAPNVPITFVESVAGISPPIPSGPPWTPTLCNLTGLVAGTYLFIGELLWGLGLANGQYGTSIQLNGVPIAQVDTVFVPPNTLPFGQSCSIAKAAIVPLDVVTLQGYQLTGGPVSPVAGLTFLQAIKLA